MYQKSSLIRRSLSFGVLISCLCTSGLDPGAAAAVYPSPISPHNIVFFVPDGLRASSVTATDAPHLYALAQQGVAFQNTHAIYPTFTTPNASAFATGHLLGDTGDFSNTLYTGYPVAVDHGSVTPFLENDAVLADIDEHFGGNYLDEMSMLAAARNAGLQTAAIGKVGPTRIQDVTSPAGSNSSTIIIDDATGTPVGLPLSPLIQQALMDAHIPFAPPPRGANGDGGNSRRPGTRVANLVQQHYYTEVADKVLLPMFKKSGKPFMLVYWSRDPDGTQHNEGDSFNTLTPGINGPTSLAAIRNADYALGQLEATLHTLHLDTTTDIVVAADHGFSTIAKSSRTSNAVHIGAPDTPSGALPVGFVAVDLALALHVKLFDPDRHNTFVDVTQGAVPVHGNGLLGSDSTHPQLFVVSNGGSDLLYLMPGPKATTLAKRIVASLAQEDYTSGIFSDTVRFGPLPGTLPLSVIGLSGASPLPRPSLVVNFRSFTTGCSNPLHCTVEIADTGLQQGQGMHGSFSRADTNNFMAAAGPDFLSGAVDTSPVSNADVGMTLAHLLRLHLPAHGHLVGRVMFEALHDGSALASQPHEQSFLLRSAAGPEGFVTEVHGQHFAGKDYFDAAGYPGRTVGL